MVRLKNQPKLRTNLDTDFLKLIAVLSMTVDHVGAVFFPEYPVFRWIGRMAFPLFCYCMTVGLLYTHDIRRYLARPSAGDLPGAHPAPYIKRTAVRSRFGRTAVF